MFVGGKRTQQTDTNEHNKQTQTNTTNRRKQTSARLGTISESRPRGGQISKTNC